MRRVLVIVVTLLALVLPAHAANTHGDAAVPELQFWMGEAFRPFVHSGCLPVVPSSSLVFAAFACEAYVRGASGELVYIAQPALTVTLTSTTGIHWLAVCRDTSSTVSGWTRRAGSHYVFQQVTAQPADPTGCAVVAQATVAASVISAVADYRRPGLPGPGWAL